MDTLGEPVPSGSERSSQLSSLNPGVPVVIDFGSSFTKVGINTQNHPAHTFITRSARFRDRKSGMQHTVVGNDILLEPLARNQVKSPFDGPLLTNWDSCEQVLDYALNLVKYEPGGDSPIAISEPLLAPHLPHRTMQELLFEGYDAPKVAFGADVLAQVKHNLDQTSPNMLLITIGSEATHVVPVIKSQPKLTYAKRINFGLRLAAEFLHELLILKYPTFPTPVTRWEVEELLRKHCFVANDYRYYIENALDTKFLSEFERRIQAPIPQLSVEASEEMEKVKQEQLQRRQESGRRLQEQTQILRAERQEKQQKELDQLEAFLTQLNEMDTETQTSSLQHAGFTDLVDVKRTIKQMSNSLKRSRGEQIEDPEPQTPLLNIPDTDLNQEELKEKRRQRLLRASYDARQRQKAEKEAMKQQQQEKEQKEAEWRSNDLEGWCKAKRAELQEVLEVIKEREKLKTNPRLRFQQTLLANTGNIADDFDAEEVEEERDYDAEASALQLKLLEFDPNFDIQQLEPQIEWKDSVIHKFLYGAHPFDPESVEQQHQLNLNVERVRVLEPIFHPQIVGVDQAGLSETVVDILKKFPELVKHIQLSGGGANINGLKERLYADLRRELPANIEINIVASNQPEHDAWRGMAQWSKNNDAYVTRKEYEENGADYFKEHKWGNPYH